MAIAFVNSGCAGADGVGSGVSNVTLDVTTGNLIVIVYSNDHIADDVSFYDSHGNTYTSPAKTDDGNTLYKTAYAYNVSGGAATTISALIANDGQSAYRTFIVMQFSGFGTSDPLDVYSTWYTGVVSSPVTNAFTTTNANDLIVVGEGGLPAASASSGYTLQYGVNYGSASYAIVSTIQTGITPGFTNTGNNRVGIQALAFKAAGSTPVTTNLSLVSAATPTAKLVRSAARKTQAVTAPPATLARSTSATRPAATSPTASLAAVKARQQTMVATTSPTAAVTRGIAHQALAATSPAGSASRSTTRALAAVAYTAGAISAIKARTMTLAAATGPVGALARAAGATRAAVSAPIATLLRQTAATRPAITAPAATLARGYTHTFIAATAPAAALAAIKARSLVLAAQTAPTAGLNRSTARFTAGVQYPVATVRKAAARRLSSGAAPLATLATIKRGAHKRRRVVTFIAGR